MYKDCSTDSMTFHPESFELQLDNEAPTQSVNNLIPLVSSEKAGSIDPVFGTNSLYSQTLDCHEPPDFGARDTFCSEPISSKDSSLTDTFPSSLPTEDFAATLDPRQLSREYLQYAQDGAPDDTFSSTPATVSSDLSNSPCPTKSDALEMASEPETLTGYEVNCDQSHPRSSNRQRGLPRRRSRYFVSRLGGKTTPVYGSNSHGLDPMQRWEEFPPEDEPAPVTAILKAMEETSLLHQTDQARRGRGKSSSRSRRSISTASRDSSASSTGRSSATSSSRSRKRQSQPRRTRNERKSSKHRIFCCTFCCDRFGSRYEWVRHEKSLHLNLESWYCAPYGPSILSLITGKHLCAYCNEMEPSQEHISGHNHDSCHGLSNELRSFRRKDHLVQHLRHTHNVQELPPLDDWKIEVKSIASRCGFCDMNFDNWDDRTSHLAKHFHRGSTMKDWKGDHGFDPHIRAQLKNAYPPYLLGWESECIVPFSATNKDAHDLYTPLMSGINAAGEAEYIQGANQELAPRDQTEDSDLPGFLDVFTRHLSQYARKQMEVGIVPTDEMFQKEARKVLFDSEDAWDQTVADNPDWLASFRQLHINPTGNSPNNGPS